MAVKAEIPEVSDKFDQNVDENFNLTPGNLQHHFIQLILSIEVKVILKFLL